MSDPTGGRRRFPLLLGSGAVVVIAVVAIAIGVNGASSPLPALPSPTPTAPVPTPSPTPHATPAPTAAATIPFADCATATFGPVLATDQPAGERAHLQRRTGHDHRHDASSTRRRS